MAVNQFPGRARGVSPLDALVDDGSQHAASDSTGTLSEG